MPDAIGDHPATTEAGEASGAELPDRLVKPPRLAAGTLVDMSRTSE